MKILFPVQVFYPSQAGGPANSVYWLTQHLTRHQFEIAILSSDQGLPENIARDEWISSDAGRVIYLKSRLRLFPLSQIISCFVEVRKTDVLHLSSVFYPPAFLTALAARLLKTKIVWSVRGELDPHALNYSRLRKKPLVWLLRRLFGGYALFHSTCDEETSYIKEVLGERTKIVQIPNYIDLPPQVNGSTGDYLLFIGRLHPKKAIDNLLRALSMCRTFLDGDYSLKIAGEGDRKYEQTLKQLVLDLRIDNKIEFVGHVEGEKKQQLLANARWTIMPSHTENFGMVVLESLSQGTPVIASKGTPWQILENERVGMWTENSPEAIARSIDIALEMDPVEYSAFRLRSRPFVENTFDVEQNIVRWIEVYNGLV